PHRQAVLGRVRGLFHRLSVPRLPGAADQALAHQGAPGRGPALGPPIQGCTGVGPRPRRADRAALPTAPYSPHLNPDELVNADLKRQLVDEVITDRSRMRAQVRSFFHSVQRLAGHVRGYFRAPHTRYTIRTI